jgi:hypothetical protein
MDWQAVDDTVFIAGSLLAIALWLYVFGFLL